MSETKRLNEKVAWVTGATRGIGRAVVMALAEEGATVCFGARSEDHLAQLEEILASKRLRAHGIALDVTSRESVSTFAARALEGAGPPDILINNAGLGIFQDIDAMSEDTFERQIDVNLKGAWYMIKAAVPHLKNQGGGHIINISSIAGRVGFRRGTAYCAAKAGLNAMAECLMLELREFGIQVITVAPGSVETTFHQQALPAAHHGDMSWMLSPETVAQSVVHLLTQPENTLVNYYELRPLQTKK